jgi:hypothetical protein
LGINLSSVVVVVVVAAAGELAGSAADGLVFGAQPA